MSGKLSLTLAVLTIGLCATAYYTRRLYVQAGVEYKQFQYVYAAIDCLIMESGQNETDVDILFAGYESRQAFANAQNKKYPGMYDPDSDLLKKRKIYNDQIPECHAFYTHFRCWALDPHDPVSLDGCGKHFELTQAEIDTMKRDPSSIERIMGEAWKRRKAKVEAK